MSTAIEKQPEAFQNSITPEKRKEKDNTVDPFETAQRERALWTQHLYEVEYFQYNRTYAFYVAKVLVKGGFTLEQLKDGKISRENLEDKLFLSGIAHAVIESWPPKESRKTVVIGDSIASIDPFVCSKE
jgi:hypothetical protein